MTTIVYQRSTKTLAADTQLTENGQEIVRMHKIRKIGRGTYAAGCGDCKGIQLIMAWVEAGLDEETKPDFTTFGETAVIVVDRKGARCRHISNEGVIWEYAEENDFVTAGSGGMYAAGALLAGANVETALRAAAAKDIFTSEPFDIIRIE